MTTAQQITRDAIRSAERSGRETGAKLATEKCAQLNERAAESYESQAHDVEKLDPRYAADLRRQARALRSAARLMREPGMVVVL